MRTASRRIGRTVQSFVEWRVLEWIGQVHRESSKEVRAEQAEAKRRESGGGEPV